jgi:hypothetical protein
LFFVFLLLSAPARFLLQRASHFTPLADLVPVFSVHRFLRLGRSSCRWSSCGDSPNLSSSQGPPTVFSPVQQFFGQSSSLSLETSLTLGFSCGPLCRPVFPATHKSSAGRCFGPRRSLVSRLWFLPVFHLPLQLFILVVSSELLCPGSPARWSCCSVGCQSSALIWFAGLVLLERRSRCRQFGNA